MNTHVLLATDGRFQSFGAVRLAHLLQKVAGAQVHVVATDEAAAFLGDGPVTDVETRPEVTMDAGNSPGARIRDQLRRVSAEAERWPITVRRGSLAPAIAEVGVELDVDCVLVGLSREAGINGYLSREMVLRLAHLTSIPVLALPADSAGIYTAVAAVDFDPLSLDAAISILRLLPRHYSILHLVHVLDDDGDLIEEAEARLRTVALALGEKAEVVVRSHVVHGSAAAEILSFARRVEADVVVAGSHGRGSLSEALTGGVAERLLHEAECAVMIAYSGSAAELRPDQTDEELVRSPPRAGDHR